MAKNVLQSTILAANGGVSVAPNAQIAVRSPSGLLVPLWLDRDGTQRASNPFYADSSGFFRVYADAGRYHIVASKDGQSQEWRDVLLGSAAGYDVDDMLAILQSGVYTSTAAGLAETPEGGFFWVARQTGTEALTLYRVVEGAAEHWADLPRGDAVRDWLQQAQGAATAADGSAQDAQAALDAILALGDLPAAVALAEAAAQLAKDRANVASASATAAAASETAAAGHEQAAQQAAGEAATSAQQAADIAVAAGLPDPIVPETFLQARSDGGGYVGRTAKQVADAVGPLVQAASQTDAGIVQLSASVSSTSTTLAATASAVKAAHDLGSSAYNLAAGRATTAYGAVGSYIFASLRSGSTASPNVNYAGSVLQPRGVRVNLNTGSAAGSVGDISNRLSGTWRCMGYANNANDAGTPPTTLFVRIS